MGSPPLLFIAAVIMAALLLFTMVYFIIMFSDLELDYLNPIDLCVKLNQVVIVEYALHAFLTLLFLFCGELACFFINLPLLAFHINNYIRGRHLLDPTVIFRDLTRHKRDCFIKLGFFMLCFFYYLYRMILALVQS